MKNLLFFIILIALITSCQKVIDVDLNETDPKFVIEANYTAEDSTVTVKLTTTSSYFDANPSTTIDAATVVITDQNGTSQSLISQGGGLFTLTNYIPQFETTYTLSVNYSGVTYTAQSTLPTPVALDSITYEYFPVFFGLDPGYVCEVNFNDPAGVPNYYIMALSRNGEEEANLTDLFLQNDELSDGNPVKRPLFTSEFFNLNDTVGLELRSVDAATYNYFSEILSIAGGQSSAAPANPANNWSNDALGYFAAYSNNRLEVIIEE